MSLKNVLRISMSAALSEDNSSAASAMVVEVAVAVLVVEIEVVDVFEEEELGGFGGKQDEEVEISLPGDDGVELDDTEVCCCCC